MGTAARPRLSGGNYLSRGGGGFREWVGGWVGQAVSQFWPKSPPPPDGWGDGTWGVCLGWGQDCIGDHSGQQA